jgi:TRAP transporter TAXI family solute receptor
MASKRFISVLLIVLLVLTMMVGCSGGSKEPSGDKGNGEAEGQVTTISISTGGTTGMYYTTHAPLADYINANSKKIRVVPATSGGSTENLANVLSGVVEIGCVYNNEVIKGYEKNNKLRFIGPTTNVSPLQFVVRADSGIKSLDDLKGKKVHLGAPGSGAISWSHEFLEYLGIIDDFIEVPLGNEEVVTALHDGDIAMFTVAGLVPAARVDEAALVAPINVLDLSEYMDDFIKQYPYYQTWKIQAGVYNGHDTDAISFGIPTSLVCLDSLPDDILTEYMTWAYGPEAQAAAESGTPVGPNHNPDDPLKSMNIPIHPAAKAFWESKGFTVPEK